MSELRHIGEQIIQNNQKLVRTIDELQNKYRQDAGKKWYFFLETIDRAEIINFFGRALYEDYNELMPCAIKFGKNVAKLAVQYHFSLSDSLRVINTYRKVIWDIIVEIVQKEQFQTRTTLSVCSIIEPMVDDITAIFVETYEMHSNNIRREKEAAEKANLAKTEFLSKMSHELRTPLNAILGFAQILEMDQELNQQQISCISEILTNGNHLLSLINEILDLSSIEAGKLRLCFDEINIHAIAQESIRSVQPMAAKKNITLRSQLDLLQEVTILADPIRIKQILLILLDNAIKYTPVNGMVTMYTVIEKESLIIHIKDSGQGFSIDEYKKIFEPFYRIEGTLEDGVGIGLSIVKQLVHLMEGQIGVKSIIGKGSDFWVQFPLIVKESTDLHGVALTEDIVYEPCLSAGRVLYIEDNESNLNLVGHIMNSQNIELITARNGKEGIINAQGGNIHVILLDLNLPDLSGFEVFDILKANPLLKDTPIIALSANAMEKDIEIALARGFDSYVTKPINVREFIATVTKLLSHKKLEHLLD
ncbi:ATP-binding protein [Bacillus sp. V5-8f]|uniref:ATP-binding response regulator n=1 Tax=Bacillus sp. V5-8f TaxID=2053044 RepID=UPI000C75C1E7|nr:ATP-binding protein [Bacillus sp. V5-8f]PLT33148.1 hypothetical protein CUU64_15320 [Bacillus sp. V5-8f]